jgi:hypothetical protein
MSKADTNLRDYRSSMVADGLNRIAELETRWDNSLDAAWAEAEAALPEGLWSIEVVKTVGASSGPYMAGTTFGPPARGYAYADTPAAALRALTSKLREMPR